MTAPLPKPRAQHFLFKRMLAEFGVRNPENFFWMLSDGQNTQKNLLEFWRRAGEGLPPEELASAEGLTFQRMRMADKLVVSIRMPRPLAPNEAYFMLAAFGLDVKKEIDSCMVFALEHGGPLGKSDETVLALWAGDMRYNLGSGPKVSNNLSVTEAAFHNMIMLALADKNGIRAMTAVRWDTRDIQPLTGKP